MIRFILILLMNFSFFASAESGFYKVDDLDLESASAAVSAKSSVVLILCKDGGFSGVITSRQGYILTALHGVLNAHSFFKDIVRWKDYDASGVPDRVNLFDATVLEQRPKNLILDSCRVMIEDSSYSFPKIQVVYLGKKQVCKILLF